MINFAQRDRTPTWRCSQRILAHIRAPFASEWCETVASVMRLDVSTPAWDRIVDGAIEYLRGRGIPLQQDQADGAPDGLRITLQAW